MKAAKSTKVLSAVQRDETLGQLKACFEANMIRHKGLVWTKVQAKLEANPANNAIDMATAMGIELLTEEQYRELQILGEFDSKTSSWLKTPEDVRKLSGAIFGDRRFGRVFVYHNGAQSYYGVRAFRGSLRV